MNLWINRGRVVSPEINQLRAVFVVGKIDEILSWERVRNMRKTCASWKVHHLQARSKLGQDDVQNLITLCVCCHKRQHRM